MKQSKSNISRYFYGEVDIQPKGVSVKTSLGTAMDDFIVNLEDRVTVKNGVIPTQHNHRPDLTSNTFFQTPRYWWLIMQLNGVNDPFENLNAGDPIRIPNL